MVILLRYYEDLSEEETANVLGLSIETIKSRTSRAIRRLSSLLKGGASAMNLISVTDCTTQLVKLILERQCYLGCRNDLVQPDSK